MNELSIWSAHGSRGDLGVFRSAAQLAEAGVTDTVVKVATGEELLEVLADQSARSIDHLALAGHGGSTWWGNSTRGVTTGRVKHRGQVTIYDVAAAAAPVLVVNPIISIASCLCSRSPLWLLRKRLGVIGSDWGERAYKPGGAASLSARLRDGLQWYRVFARVRGHRASGHATALALLAEHRGFETKIERGLAGNLCTPLFELALPGIDPDWRARRWWTSKVTGRLARRWLMGDDSVIQEIRELWGFGLGQP